MIVRNAEAGLLLKNVIVSELSISNQLAKAEPFDENSQILDVDYEIFNVDSDDHCFYAEVELKTKVVIKSNRIKYFEMKINHVGFLVGRKDVYENQESFYNAIELNGVASLISFARANIASITSLTFCQGNIMLPMINVFKLNRLKKEKLKRSK